MEDFKTKLIYLTVNTENYSFVFLDGTLYKGDLQNAKRYVPDPIDSCH